MSREAAIIATLIAYKVVLVAFGWFARRRIRDGSDYFLAGRGLGPVVASLSASASSSSAWTLLGVSGAAYAWGLGAIWLFPACVGGFLFNWYLLAPALHRLSHSHHALTTTEVLAASAEGRWRQAVVWVASLIILLSLGTYIASQFQGAGKTFTETFGLAPQSSILIGAAIVVLYTMLGGFWAVSLTDTLQGLLMALSAIVLPGAALLAVGGPTALVHGMQAIAAPGYMSLTRDLAGAAGLGFVFGLLGIGLGYPGQPHVVNRFMALRATPGAVVVARRVAMAWAVIVYSGMILLGWCGRVLFAQLADGEVVMVRAANELFAPVVAGIILAAVLSAVMSTADSQLLVVTSTVTHDLGLHGESEAARTWRARVATLAVTVAAALLAILGSQEIFSRVLFAWSAMGSAFGPLLLVTAWRGPVSPRLSLLAMSAGFLLSVTAYTISETKGGVFERVLPFVVALAIALWPPKKSDAPLP